MLKRAVGPLFVITGALHFVVPKSYMAMMPRYLPAHRERRVEFRAKEESLSGAGARIWDTQQRVERCRCESHRWPDLPELSPAVAGNPAQRASRGCSYA
jgi:hypothetical protein